MLRNRVIPALLLNQTGLVKTTQYKNPKYIGDPINVIRIFNEKEVDELLVLDISASKEKREPNYNLIKEIAEECFMPVTYGGGIQNLEQANKIFSCGIEKICIQSAVIYNPNFINDLVKYFGTQSIMISVDVKKNSFSLPCFFHASEEKILELDLFALIKDFVNAGAGEILLNAVDKEGTLSGPDLKLIQKVSQLIKVPLIASGGISSLSDIKAAIDAGANAVAVGTFFVYYGPHQAVLITYPKYSELEKLFTKER
jgi:cyclase